MPGRQGQGGRAPNQMWQPPSPTPPPFTLWQMNPQFNGMRPQIILLRDGTDTSQGKGQLISNINACQAVVEAVRTTLGPRGMDKLVVAEGGKVGCLWGVGRWLVGVWPCCAPPPPSPRPSACIGPVLCILPLAGCTRHWA
jgi:hypothetical protein